MADILSIWDWKVDDLDLRVSFAYFITVDLEINEMYGNIV